VFDDVALPCPHPSIRMREVLVLVLVVALHVKGRRWMDGTVEWVRGLFGDVHL